MPLQDYLSPDRTYSNWSAIRLPDNNTRGSEFTIYLIALVGQNPFHGFPAAHPLDHIVKLEDMEDDNYNRCKLFSFSLKGDAIRWLNQFSSGSLTCWKEIRSAFINNFFDEESNWKARNEISTFSQVSVSPSRMLGEDSGVTNLSAHTMVFPRFSSLIFSSEVSIGHTKQLWTLRVKGISKPGAQKKQQCSLKMW